MSPLRPLRRLTPGVATVALVFATLVTLATPASAAVGTTDLTGDLTAEDLANQLAGDGVTVTAASFTGDERGGGSFTGGAGIVGLTSGVVLSSGNIADVAGPNDSPSTTTAFGTAGDADLNALSGSATSDAAVLEFDFEASTDQVQFSYVFSSEEYNEFVNQGFNDAFGFFVNGQNCALVGDPAVPVSIDTINLNTNASLYINNDASVDPQLDTEMDGLTVVLTCEATVTPGEPNHMKLAIADAGDSSLDSAVFLGQGSFVAVHTLSVETVGDGSGTVTSDPAGIDCGEDCSEGFEEDTMVSLTATPDAGSVFGGWSGDCTGLGACEVTMDQARSVTATFEPEPTPVHTLTVERDGEGSGTVTSDPAGIDCGEDCSEDFEEGTVVTLTAAADEGSEFDTWSVGGCGAALDCVVTIDDATQVTATFAAVDPCPEGSGCDAGTVPPGESLSTVQGPPGNPVSPADPFAIDLTNVTDDTITGTITEEACDGTQQGDPLCSVPRVGGSAGNFQFSMESGAAALTTTGTTVGNDADPVTIGRLFFDKSVLVKKAPKRVYYQKALGEPVLQLPKCRGERRTECFRITKLSSGDQIVTVPFSTDPRVTRG